MKLFNKIATLLAGFSLAVGAGVAAVANQQKVKKADAAAPYDFTGDTLTFASQSLSNGVQYDGTFTNGKVSVSFTGGGNDGKYYTTGSGIRTYGGGAINVSINAAYLLTEVAFTWDGSNAPASDYTIDKGSYSTSTKKWTGETNSFVLSRNSGSGHWRLKSMSFTYKDNSAPHVSGVTISGDMTKKSYTSVDSWSNAGLSASVTMSDSSAYTGSVDWTYNPTSPATVVANNSGEAVNNTSVEVTATASGTAAKKTVSGVNIAVANVAQAIAATPATGTLPAVVKGIVSQIDGSLTQSGYVNYYISDDGTTTDQFEVYRGKGLNGVDFTSESDLQLGDIVTISGTLLTYAGVKEFSGYSSILKLERPETTKPSIFINETNVKLMVGGADVTLTAEANNIPDGGSVKWSSATTVVATINATSGLLHAVAAGTSVITASIVNSSNETVASHSTTVTVVESVVKNGDSFIIYAEHEETTYYLAGVENKLGTVSETKADALTVTAVEDTTKGQFALQTGSTYLAAINDNKLVEVDTIDETALWTLTNNGVDIEITNISFNDRLIQFNYNNSNPRFACYKGTQNNVLIEKLAEPTTVTLAEHAVELENGKTHKLAYTSDQPAGFTWVSSNPAVATVDNAGNVECIANTGTATIRVFYDANGNGSYDSGEPTDTCVITAVPAQIDFSSTNYGGVATLIENVADLDGKKVVLGSATKGALAGALSGSFLTAVNDEEIISYDETNKVFTVGDGRTDTGVLVLDVKAVTGGFTLQNSDGKYLMDNSSKNLSFSDTSFTWTISITDGAATIQGNFTMVYNSAQPRFKTYDTSTYTTGSAVELYSFASYYDEAAEFAELFITGDTNGTCAETIENWNDLGDLFAMLSTGAKNIFKIASHLAPSSYTDNTDYSVEHAVARYDLILLTHEELRTNEFMGRTVEGTLVYANNISINLLGNNNTLILVIVISSMVAVSALGIYLIIKKRKHN